MVFQDVRINLPLRHDPLEVQPAGSLEELPAVLLE
jgi:hypothetical protein